MCQRSRFAVLTLLQVVAVLAVTGCSLEPGGGDSGALASSCGAGSTRQRYAPLRSPELELWPDGRFEVPDGNYPSGITLRLHEEVWAAVTSLGVLRSFVRGAEQSGGYPANGQILFRFEGEVGPVPATLAAAARNPAFRLVDLDARPPAEVPFRVTTIEEGKAIVFDPLRPLAFGHEHVAIVTTAATDASGGCLAPSETTSDMLRGAAPSALAPTGERWLRALDTVGVAPSSVAAVTAFRVHDEPKRFQAIARSLDANAYAFHPVFPCFPSAGMRRCEFLYDPVNYAIGAHLPTVGATGRFLVPVTIWLPAVANPNAIPIVFGHGANSTREVAKSYAEELVPRGYVVIAADAPRHGRHPTSTAVAASDPTQVVRFLGIDPLQLELDVFEQRGNFNQAALEWAQLAELVSRSGEPYRDGRREWNPARVGYIGQSLGALIGAGVLALSDDIDAGVLEVGGGGLRTFITDSKLLDLDLLLSVAALSEETAERLLFVYQTAVDSADPATWGSRILHDRLIGRAPDTLLYVTIHDGTVPFASGSVMARALRAPQTTPAFVPLEPLPVVAPPLWGNVEGVTEGYVQFDQVLDDSGALVDAQHDLPYSAEATALRRHFFETFRATGQAEIAGAVP